MVMVVRLDPKVATATSSNGFELYGYFYFLPKALTFPPLVVKACRKNLTLS